LPDHQTKPENSKSGPGKTRKKNDMTLTEALDIADLSQDAMNLHRRQVAAFYALAAEVRRVRRHLDAIKLAASDDRA